jgi:hypothetical protein
MRNLHLVGLGTAVVAMLVACRAGAPSETLPSTVESARWPGASGSCAAGNLAVNVRVPSNSGIAKIDVTDSIYGYAQIGACSLSLMVSSQCKASSGGHICTARFEALAAVNDIEIDAYKSNATVATTSGAFPQVVPKSKSVTANAILGGSIATISVEPFLTPTGLSPAARSPAEPPSSESSLPIGQNEKVWVVARDSEKNAIIGQYAPHVAITATNLKALPSMLESSADAERLQVRWSDPLTVASVGTLTARASSKLSSSVRIQPASGIVYFTPGPNTAKVGPGPVAVYGGNVYFVINDQSGCKGPGHCKTMLGEFTAGSSKPTFSYVPLNKVPGISQLYFTSDGALWLATFQPVGTWSYALPALHMARGGLSNPSPLPSSFGEASGFVEDSSHNLWISSCGGANCLQNHAGTPTLAETNLNGWSQGPRKTVPLPLYCANFGYLGFTVGDVAISGGSLYVIGLNDGSAPPATGAIWKYTPASSSSKASCVAVPTNFNPSAYFATTPGSSSSTLVFGAGGNLLDFRWPPDHGFYKLANGMLKSPAPDVTPYVTANHVSATAGPSPMVYYVHEDNLGNGVNVSGLGTYEPASGDWSVFPTASFTGQQNNDGVAAQSDGAWFSAANVCNPWNGVCLGRARYLEKWGVVPSFELPAIAVGTGEGFATLEVPGGVFSAFTPASPDVCTVQPPSGPLELTFRVIAGNRQGPCPIVVSERRNGPLAVHGGIFEQVVTKVEGAAPR